MPEHASRFVGLYDQQNENRIPDWGGDELFTRMPRPRAVDTAPPPRHSPPRPADPAAERRLVLVEPHSVSPASRRTPSTS